METLKRQTTAVLRMAVWLQVKVRGHGFSLQPIGCTPTLSAQSLTIHVQ